MNQKSMKEAMLKNMIEKTGKPIEEWISIVNEQKFVENKSRPFLVFSTESNQSISATEESENQALLATSE